MPLVEPTETSRAEVRELGSKFYGYVFPVNNPEALQINLDQLKKRYSDATHICYAYRLGTSGNVHRASDDGEPKYSAGVPIYNQIKSANMTNVLVAVVRYYGGTNLGVPGLVKAYGSAAAEALAFVATQLALDEFSLTFHVMPSKVGVVYDLARKAGAGVSLKEMHTDGSQSLNVFGKGSPNILAKTIQDKLS